MTICQLFAVFEGGIYFLDFVGFRYQRRDSVTEGSWFFAVVQVLPPACNSLYEGPYEGLYITILYTLFNSSRMGAVPTVLFVFCMESRSKPLGVFRQYPGPRSRLGFRV